MPLIMFENDENTVDATIGSRFTAAMVALWPEATYAAAVAGLEDDFVDEAPSSAL